MNRNQVTLLNPWRVGQSSQLSFRSSDHSSPPRPWIHSAGAKSGDYKNRHERSSSPQENQKHLKSEIDPSYTISVLKEKNITLMQLSFVFLFLEWRHSKLILHYSPLQCFSWTLNHYDRLEYLCFILDVLRCEDFHMFVGWRQTTLCLGHWKNLSSKELVLISQERMFQDCCKCVTLRRPVNVAGPGLSYREDVDTL